MSLEIYKLYNNNEVSIDKFEIVHESSFGNPKIEPYIIKNNANDYIYQNVVVTVEDVNNNNTDNVFLFKIILGELEPNEEAWSEHCTSFNIPSISKSNTSPHQFKFWVRTYSAADTLLPGLYSNKLKLKLSYTKVSQL